MSLILFLMAVLATQAFAAQYGRASIVKMPNKSSAERISVTVFTNWKYDPSKVNEYQQLLREMLAFFVRYEEISYFDFSSLTEYPREYSGDFVNTYIYHGQPFAECSKVFKLFREAKVMASSDVKYFYVFCGGERATI